MQTHIGMFLIDIAIPYQASFLLIEGIIINVNILSCEVVSNKTDNLHAQTIILKFWQRHSLPLRLQTLIFISHVCLIS